jgi:catenin alpha
LENNSLLEELIAAAFRGNHSDLQNKIVSFKEYANKLIEISLLAASISKNAEGVQLVEITANRVYNLLPKVINASEILCSLTDSEEAKHNMEVYKQAWIKELKLLSLALDDITSINDFLSVSEAQILQDIKNCINALNSSNAKDFNHLSNQIISRTIRVCDVVNSEMSNFEKCDFTIKVIETVKIIRTNFVSNFIKAADYAKQALNSQPMKDPNENEFIEASRNIYDSVRELRNALLLIPQQDEDWDNIEDEEILKQETVDSNSNDFNKHQADDFEEESQSETSNLLNSNNITQEQKEELTQNLDSFNKEKKNFDKEVLKWDEKSNDIVVLSKEMCVLMMNMTDYTRGRGPYKTVESVILAAKKISQIGSKLEKLIKELCDSCPESQSKVELLGYLKKLPLFLNQLNVVAKVKENVFDVSY